MMLTTHKQSACPEKLLMCGVWSSPGGMYCCHRSRNIRTRCGVLGADNVIARSGLDVHTPSTPMEDVVLFLHGETMSRLRRHHPVSFCCNAVGSISNSTASASTTSYCTVFIS